MRGQKLSTLNVGNLLLILGLGALGASFWLPYGTAERVHRIEKRASRFAAKMLEVIATRPEISWQDASAEQTFAATINEWLNLKDPSSSIYLKSRQTPARLRGTAWWLEGKHYLYMVTTTPVAYLGLDDQDIERPGPKDKPPSGDQPPGKDPLTAQKKPATETRPRPIEVYAWPKDSVQGAMSVFFYGTTTTGAFQRNLSKRYMGASAFPKAGDAFPHHQSANARIYYGYDDERWQLLGK